MMNEGGRTATATLRERGEPARRGQDVAMLALGAWLVISPWVLGGFPALGSSVDSWAIGGIVFLSSLWAVFNPRLVALDWINALCGLWLIGAPFWINGLERQHVDTWVVGAIILVLSLTAAAAKRRAV